MISAQHSKFAYLIAPQAIVNNAYWAGSHQHGSVNNSVDCFGYHYATINFLLGATDIAVAELSIYESDDNSTFTQIAATDFSVAAVGTLPSATADNTNVRFLLDLRKRKRYLRINAKNGSGSTGGYATAWAELSRAGVSPSTATERGLAQQVIV